MYAKAWLATLVVAVTLTGCSREKALTCESGDRYAAARSTQPIQIPDDLTPPAEDEALRLPPETGNPRAPSQPCLESPPSFYGEGRPSRTGRPPDPAAQPAAPADGPGQPEDPERAISN